MKRGYITYMGYQVQENLQVPTCYPGLVMCRGQAYPPKASKWDKVVLKDGALKVDDVLLRGGAGYGSKPKRLRPISKDELLTLPKEPMKVPRWTHALAGIGVSGARPMVSLSNAYNQGKALAGRVFLAQAPAEWGEGPKPGLWDKVFRFADLLLPDFRKNEMGLEDWIHSMPSRRRKALRLASIFYARRGWKESYSRFKAFVKTELLPGFTKSGGNVDRLIEMLDRLIQGPHDITHVIAGPRLKPLVHRLKELWTSSGPIFYGSAKPGKLHHFLQRLHKLGGTYFWCDFSMFDCTHTTDTWGFMERLYQKAGICDPDFWRVMKAWRTPGGTCGPFKYQAGVVNASGRDDTALANGILNGFATYLSAVSAYLDVPLESLTVEQVRSCMNLIVLSVCGDDSLGTVLGLKDTAGFVSRFNLNIRMFGFEAKLCVSNDLRQAVYLGHRPYPVSGTWYWGKTIGRAVYKAGWVVLRKDCDVMATMTGIAEMNALCCGHVPVLADIAKQVIELRRGAKRTPVSIDPNQPWQEMGLNCAMPYAEDTLEAVAEVYSAHSTAYCKLEGDRKVTVDDVKDLISAIRSVKRLPCVVDHWLLRHMVVFDDL